MDPGYLGQPPPPSRGSGAWRKSLPGPDTSPDIFRRAKERAALFVLAGAVWGVLELDPPWRWIALGGVALVAGLGLVALAVARKGQG